jgi:hypothetical protein
MGFRDYIAPSIIGGLMTGTAGTAIKAYDLMRNHPIFSNHSLADIPVKMVDQYINEIPKPALILGGEVCVATIAVILIAAGMYEGFKEI